MISWIQHHLIRHGRWIFLTLLAVIIIAFVFTIGNTPGCTTDSSRYKESLFYGIDLNSQRATDLIVEKVSMSAFLNRMPIRNEQQFQAQVMNRIALLHLADKLGIPAPSQEALARYIKTKSAFSGPDGAFSRDSYSAFVDQFETNPRASEQMMVSVLEEDFRIEQLTEVLAGPGYFLPSEASAEAQRNRTTLALTTAELAFADFQPEIEPDEETLKNYYEENKQRYEIPERIQASYVLFENERFVDQASEASAAELREHFAENRAEFVAEYEASQPEPTDSADESASESAGDEPAETVTFEKVRDAVAASYAEQQSSLLANQAAQGFALQLYRDSIALDSAGFNQLLNESKVTLIEIEPYTEAGASQRMLSPELLESAFALTGKRYYSDPYEIEGGFAVLIYEGRIDPLIPPFEEVAAEVTADYEAEKKRELFNEKGESLKAELEAALEEGTAFSEAAESLGLKINTYESFQVKDAPAQLNNSALQQAESMDEGEISPMLNLRGSGTFVYLETKQVPELSEEDPDLAQTRSMLERFTRFTTRGDLINELVLRGLPPEANTETSE